MTLRASIVALVLLTAAPALAQVCPDEMLLLKLDKPPPEYPHPDRQIAGCTEQIEHPGPELSVKTQSTAYINRASFLVLVNRNEEALADLEKASQIPLNSDRIEGLTRGAYIDYATGVALARMGRPQEARRAFESAQDEARLGNLGALNAFVRAGMDRELGNQTPTRSR